MIKIQKHISLLILAIAFGVIGCNPGIIDVPPPEVTNASSYFFPKNSLSVIFQDSSSNTYGKFVPFTLSFSAIDPSNSFFLKENPGTTSADSLSCSLDSGAVSITGITSRSIISLPTGFSIKAKYKLVSEQIAAPISHVVTTEKGTVIAACDEIGLFYSSDGNNWTPLALPFGSKNNRITALAVHGSNVFAGTLSGLVYMSRDNGLTWGSSPIQIFKDSILAFASATTDISPLYISVGGSVYKTPSPGTIPATPIGASNGGKLFTSLALYSGNNSDSVLYGGTLGSGLWVRHDGAWNQVPGVPSTSFVFSVSATPTTVYCATNKFIYSSGNGTQWSVISTLPYGILSYDGNRHGVIAANPFDSVVLYNDSNPGVESLPSLPVKSLHDLSAANFRSFAATDSGVYELSSINTKHWLRIFSPSVTRSVTKEFPGDIVLLRSRTGNNTLDSSWQADTIITKSLPPIPITARIIGHLDQVKMSDSTTYSDVIEIRYASEVAGQPAASVPYWDILYAKNVGPIIIFQISNSVKTRKIYRSRY